MDARELEVLGTRTRRNVDDPRALVECDLVPRDHAVSNLLLCRELVEWTLVLEPDELLAPHGPYGLDVPGKLTRAPRSLGVEHVLGIRLHRRRDVGRQRPRRRRPDHQRLALAPLEREANEERGVLHLPVVLLARLLVLGERGAAARAPLGRAVAHVEPAPLVALLEEAPDVLDVRVREGEVVVAPVHPLAEPLGLLGHDADVLGDALLAAFGELGDAVLLDLPLRVEAELRLHPDLDPEPLAVEPVLIALVATAQRSVALEDVLQRAAPGVMHAHRVVRGDRPVDEAETRAAGVLLAKTVERPLALPALEHLAFEGGMIGHIWERREHSAILASGNKLSDQGV